MNDITPPPELVEEWAHLFVDHTDTEVFSAVAQWGADQELDACLKALDDAWDDPANSTVEELQQAVRAARRPKPPSLKEQALRVLVENGTNLDGRMELDSADIEIISRALEALPND
jgi:hypothetical protein